MVRGPDPGAPRNRPYYERLEVGPAASRDDIVRAYRRLALGVHPDAHPEDPEASRRFREITEAYEVLADPDRRQAYDRTRGTGGIPVHLVSSPADGGQPDYLRAEAPPTYLGSPRGWPTGSVPLRAGPVHIEAGAADLVEVHSATPHAPRWALAELFELLDSWRTR
jgi:curved DNA-binding protein CbpA